jgi:hypothetical protein
VVASGASSQAAYSRKSCRLTRLDPAESKHFRTPARAPGLGQGRGETSSYQALPQKQLGCGLVALVDTRRTDSMVFTSQEYIWVPCCKNIPDTMLADANHVQLSLELKTVCFACSRYCCCVLYSLHAFLNVPSSLAALTCCSCKLMAKVAGLSLTLAECLWLYG